MSETLSDVHHEWATNFSGIDTRSGARPANAPNGASVASTSAPASRPGNRPAAPTGGTNSTLTIPIQGAPFNVAAVVVRAQYFVARVRVDLTLGGAIEFRSGAAQADSTVTAATGYDAGFVQRIGTTWYNGQGHADLGLPSSIEQVALTGQARVQNGLEVSVQGTLTLTGGWSLGLSVRVVKVGNTGRLSGPAAAISGSPPPIQVSIPVDNSGTLTGTAQFSLSVELEPRYDEIIAALARDAAVDGAETTTAARVGVSVMSFEAFLTAGLVAGAAVVLWATMSSLTGNDAAQAAGGAVTRLTDGLTDAFIAGATGGQAPSDQALQPGYSAGQQFLQSVAAGNGPNEPPMREDDAAGALSDLLPGRRAGIRAHMLPLARNAIWDRFSREHQGDTQAMNTARRVIFQ